MFNILSEDNDDATWFLEEYALNPMNAAGDCMAAIAEEISASTFMPIMVSFCLYKLDKGVPTIFLKLNFEHQS